MVRPLWCGRYGAAVMVRPLWCGDSMVLVFYGARQYGAMVPRIFLLFGIFGGPYKGRFDLYKINVGNYSFHIVNDRLVSISTTTVRSRSELSLLLFL